MRSFLLDTHAIIWLLCDSNRMDNNFKEDIEYFNGTYAISVISIAEIINLIQLNKIELNISINNLYKELGKRNIKILGINQTELINLEKLPTISINNKKHSDLFDRIIIATAISYRITLASADSKFPKYRHYGLDLLDISA